MIRLQDARTISPEQLFERRKQAVALFKKGMLRKDIAPIVGVGRNKVGEWIAVWQEGGIRALKVGKAGAPKGSGLRLNRFEQERIRKTIIKDAPDQLKLPFALWTREAVRQLIEQFYGIDLPIRTVGNYLRNWGFTPQKPVKRAYERDDKKVKKWLEEDFPELAKRAKAEGGEVHWGDETGVKSEDQVGRGYAPQGQTPVRKHRGSPEKINMISTVTNQGKVRFMFYDGSMNADRLIEFLRRLIRRASRKVFLVLDNLRVHHAKKVRAWLSERKEEIEVHYLPSYSPDLNPDEYLNCDLKGELSRRPSSKRKGSLADAARTEMRKLAKNPKRVISYFTSSKLKHAA